MADAVRTVLLKDSPGGRPAGLAGREKPLVPVDDQEVAGLRVDGVPTQDVDSQWLRRTTAPRPTTSRLGWEGYGGDQDTIWYDDVALSSSPLSC